MTNLTFGKKKLTKLLEENSVFDKPLVFGQKRQFFDF